MLLEHRKSSTITFQVINITTSRLLKTHFSGESAIES